MDANNIEELKIKEPELIQYISKDYLNQIPIYDQYSSNYISFSTLQNIISQPKQSILLVYCPLDEKCPILIILPKLLVNLPYNIEYEIKLTEDNQSFLMQFIEIFDYDLYLLLPNSQNEMIFYFNATMYSGAIEIVEIKVNNKIIEANRKISTTNDII